MSFTHRIGMDYYEQNAFQEMYIWQNQMKKPPSLINKLAGEVQHKINNVIPEKVHKAITAAIKQMTKAVILGAEITAQRAEIYSSLHDCENKVRERIRVHSNAAAAEGALTGAGGILLGLADFPLWLAIKIKLLFEIAAAYGHDTTDYKERLFILHIFQITFSTPQKRLAAYNIIANWDRDLKNLPDNIDEFDWRTFQQEYRDYIDIAKLLQLIPGIGAAVGAFVNHRLTKKLGATAINAYRMRWESK